MVNDDCATSKQRVNKFFELGAVVIGDALDAVVAAVFEVNLSSTDGARVRFVNSCWIKSSAFAFSFGALSKRLREG